MSLELQKNSDISKYFSSERCLSADSFLKKATSISVVPANFNYRSFLTKDYKKEQVPFHSLSAQFQFSSELKKQYSFENLYVVKKASSVHPEENTCPVSLFDGEAMDGQYFALLNIKEIELEMIKNETEKKVDFLIEHMKLLNCFNSFQNTINSYAETLVSPELSVLPEDAKAALKIENDLKAAPSISALNVDRKKEEENNIFSGKEGRVELTQSIQNWLKKSFIPDKKSRKFEIPKIKSFFKKPCFTCHAESEELFEWDGDEMNPYDLLKLPKLSFEIEKINKLIDKYDDVYFGTEFTEEGLYKEIENTDFESIAKKPKNKTL